MASASFYIRQAQNKSAGIINVRFTWSRSGKYRKSLALEIPVKAWDKKKQRVKDIAIASKYRHEVNQQLDQVEKWFEAFEKKHAGIDRNLVKSSFESYLNPKEIKSSVVEFIDYYKEEVAPFQINPKSKKPVGKRAIQGYETTKRWLKKYEAAKKIKLHFVDLNLDFHKSFLNFLFDDNNLAPNTVGGYIKNLKLFARQAKKMGLATNPATLYSEFYLPGEESKSVYLNEDEIKMIFEHDFSKNPRFEKVRDWSIIGLWTGLRVSDWKKFGSIENGMITIKPQKTQFTSGKSVVIPIHPMVKEMIEERGMPQELSDVEFNRVIKDVCHAVGITYEVYGSRMNPKTKRKETGYFPKNTLVSSHTCRRSFATNLYKSYFPTLSIMQITGHTTEKSFLKYIKVTPKEHALKLESHWKNFYKK